MIENKSVKRSVETLRRDIALTIRNLRKIKETDRR